MSHSTTLGELAGQLGRFVIVGGTNTAGTLALFVALQLVCAAWLAYSIAFAVGLVYSACLTSRWVFRSPTRAFRIALLIAWYIGVYGVGEAVIAVVRHGHHPSAIITAFITVTVTAPLNFVGARSILPRPRALAAKEERPPSGT